MANPAISLEFDLGSSGYAFGFLQGLTETIKTDRYIGSVLQLAHAEMAKSFDEFIDVAAAGNPSELHHVYEWRMVGMPAGRLWRHTIGGRSGVVKEKRYYDASWEWEISKMPILTPEERLTDLNPIGSADPIHAVSPAMLAKLKQTDYYFRWKAPVMEYGLHANVYPRSGKANALLFVPSWRSVTHGGYYKAKHTQQNFEYADPQDKSGGYGTVGRFTSMWVGWWNSGAPDETWKLTVQNIVEKDIGRSEREMIVGANRRRSRTKIIGMATFNDEYAAFESGRNRAMAYYTEHARSYVQATKVIDRRGIFGE